MPDSCSNPSNVIDQILIGIHLRPRMGLFRSHLPESTRIPNLQDLLQSLQRLVPIYSARLDSAGRSRVDLVGLPIEVERCHDFVVCTD